MKIMCKEVKTVKPDSDSYYNDFVVYLPLSEWAASPTREKVHEKILGRYFSYWKTYSWYSEWKIESFDYSVFLPTDEQVRRCSILADYIEREVEDYYLSLDCRSYGDDSDKMMTRSPEGWAAEIPELAAEGFRCGEFYAHPEGSVASWDDEEWPEKRLKYLDEFFGCKELFTIGHYGSHPNGTDVIEQLREFCRLPFPTRETQ